MHLMQYLLQVFPTIYASLSYNLDNNEPALSAAKKRKTSDLCEIPTIANLPVFHTDQDKLFLEAVKESMFPQKLKKVEEYLKNGQNPNSDYCLHLAVLNKHDYQTELVDMLSRSSKSSNSGVLLK